MSQGDDPTPGDAESLNVAAAGAIALYELGRRTATCDIPTCDHSGVAEADWDGRTSVLRETVGRASSLAATIGRPEPGGARGRAVLEGVREPDRARKDATLDGDAGVAGRSPRDGSRVPRARVQRADAERLDAALLERGAARRGASLRRSRCCVSGCATACGRRAQRRDWRSASCSGEAWALIRTGDLDEAMSAPRGGCRARGRAQASRTSIAPRSCSSSASSATRNRASARRSDSSTRHSSSSDGSSLALRPSPLGHLPLAVALPPPQPRLGRRPGGHRAGARARRSVLRHAASCRCALPGLTRRTAPGSLGAGAGRRGARACALRRARRPSHCRPAAEQPRRARSPPGRRRTVRSIAARKSVRDLRRRGSPGRRRVRLRVARGDSARLATSRNWRSARRARRSSFSATASTICRRSGPRSSRSERSLAAQGRLDDAEAWIAAAERSFEQASSAGHRSYAWVARGDLQSQRGNDRDAADLYRRAARALQTPTSSRAQADDGLPPRGWRETGRSP